MPHRKKKFPGKDKEVISEKWEATKAISRIDAYEKSLEHVHARLDQMMEEMDRTSKMYARLREDVDNLKGMDYRVQNVAESVERLKKEKADKTENVLLEEKKVNRREIQHLLDLPADFFYKLMALMKEFEQLSLKFDHLENQIMDITDSSDLTKLRDDLDKLELEFAKFLERLSHETTQEEQILEEGDLRQMQKIMQCNLMEVTSTVDGLAWDNVENQKQVTNVQHSLIDLNISKADKTDMCSLLDKKASLKQLEKKVDKMEFMKKIDIVQLNIKTLAENMKATEEALKKQIDGMTKDLPLKMYRAEFDTLSTPLRNRMQALMENVKKIKKIIGKVIYPEAAGVTKCISCGRAAELAAGNYSRSTNMALGPQKNYGYSHNKHTASDKKAENISMNKGPGPELSKDCDSQYMNTGSDRKDGDHSKSTGLAFEPAQDDSSQNKDNWSGKKEEEVSESAIETPKDGNSQNKNFELDKKAESVSIGSTESDIQPQKADDFENKDNDSNKKAGDTSKNVVSDPRQSKDDSDKNIDAEEVLDLNYINFVEPPLSRCKSPRYCGGPQTPTESLQKGLKFRHMKLPNEPHRKELRIIGYNSKVYNGAFEVLDTTARKEFKKQKFEMASVSNKSEEVKSGLDNEVPIDPSACAPKSTLIDIALCEPEIGAVSCNIPQFFLNGLVKLFGKVFKLFSCDFIP